MHQSLLYQVTASFRTYLSCRKKGSCKFCKFFFYINIYFRINYSPNLWAIQLIKYVQFIGSVYFGLGLVNQMAEVYIFSSIPLFYPIAIHIIMGCEILGPVGVYQVAVWCLAGWVFPWFRWCRSGSHMGVAQDPSILPHSM